MIYVKRDPALIPKKLLDVAARAQEQLENLPANERVAFIKKKSHIWRAFKRHLRTMSYGKCWYSEAIGPQSPYDVDHFRPKSEAQRSEAEKDEGYPWLAFDWDNFRYSAERSNRLSTDEDTGEVLGKSSWFPLGPDSPTATWRDRCVMKEKPLLLDPTKEADVALIDVGSDGLMVPSRTCTTAGKERVAASVRLYGLDLPDLLSARRQVMVDLNEDIDKLLLLYEGAMDAERDNDPDLIEKHRKAISSRTLPNRPFTLAARAKLIERGLPQFLAGPEDYASMVA